MIKEVVKRCAISFVISAVCGLVVNLVIDLIANAVGANADGGFISMSPEFRKLFATPVIAAYINIPFSLKSVGWSISIFCCME